MQQVFKEITERVDSMQLRERALLLIAVTVVLVFLVDSLGFQLVFKEQEQEKTAISDLEQKLHILRERTGLLSGDMQTDPSSRRDRLHAKLSELDGNLHRQLGGLLDPGQAIEVLEQVLAQEQGLILLKVDAISSPLDTMKPEQKNSQLETTVGRYGLQLQLEGSFLATRRYLLALESLPWKFFWEGVDFEVIEYPNARVTLDIYTLGLLEG